MPILPAGREVKRGQVGLPQAKELNRRELHGPRQELRRLTAGGYTCESDIDVIVFAPTERPYVERFRDYLPAIVEAGAGVDLFVYTPAEFEQMRAEERPFLSHAMESARPIHVG